ncbi:MAG TPA: signal peptidase II [Candidatus Nanoarchaeia archaeon]|nr:signal peptidase II [Candidatus Nanoarchaeia archaeon]
MVEFKPNKLLLLFVMVTTITIIIDQITKAVISGIRPNFTISFLNLGYFTNTGAGFGLLQDKIVLLTIISILVAVMTIIGYREIPKLIWPQLFTALFLGGVIGNLLDRLFRGLVIDFINFSFWPAFNVADMAITVGIIGIIIIVWRKKS